jgi:hypothetical protein
MGCNWSGAVIVEGFKAAGRMNTDYDLRRPATQNGEGVHV